MFFVNLLCIKKKKKSEVLRGSPCCNVLLFPQVSQGDATEKLAHQVAAQVAAADRRLEEASGDPHEAEKDEAHKSSKGHVSGKYSLCCMEKCWNQPVKF